MIRYGIYFILLKKELQMCYVRVFGNIKVGIIDCKVDAEAGDCLLRNVLCV